MLASFEDFLQTYFHHPGYFVFIGFYLFNIFGFSDFFSFQFRIFDIGRNIFSIDGS
jgi:hypothetical protein